MPKHCRTRIGLLALIIHLTAGVLTLSGQGLVTDRPDFTESAVTVPKGFVQFEGGQTLTDLPGDRREWVIGEPLFRVGLDENIELRIGAPSYVLAGNGRSHDGFGDASVGAKVQLGPVDGTDLAAIVSTSVPVGEEPFSSDEFDPTVILTGGRALNEEVGLGAQIVFASVSDGSDRALEWGGTVVVSTSISARSSIFGELALTVPESGSAPLVAHTGIVYASTDRFQLDVHGGFGLNDSAPDVFLGAGLAARVD